MSQNGNAISEAIFSGTVMEMDSRVFRFPGSWVFCWEFKMLSTVMNDMKYQICKIDEFVFFRIFCVLWAP